MARSVYRFGPWRLISQEMLLKAGQRVTVTPKELAVLSLLVERAGQVVTKDELLDTAWRGEEVSEGSLTRCVYLLRKRLDLGDGVERIETVPRIGFRFAQSAVRDQPLRGDASGLRLGVLPVSGSLDHIDTDWVATLHEEMIALLVPLHRAGVTVIARDTMTEAHHRFGTTSSIAEALQLDFTVTSTLRAILPGRRVRVELNRTRDSALVWTDAFDVSIGTLDARLQQAALAIIAALPVTPRPSRGKVESMPASPAVGKALEWYYRARHHQALRTPQNLERALEFYARCVELDPSHARALAETAEIHLSLASFGLRPLDEALEHSLAAATRAIDVQPDLAVAQSAHGLALTVARRFDAAEHAFRRATRLESGDSLVRFNYARHLLCLGHVAAAAEQLELALAVDPFSPTAGPWLGYAYFCAHRRGDALAQLERAHRIFAEVPVAQSFYALVCAREGDLESALTTIRRTFAAFPVPAIASVRAYVEALAGHTEVARGILASMHAQARQCYVTPAGFIAPALILDGPSAALEWLELAVSQQCFWTGIMANDPRLDPLRSDPRFIAALAAFRTPVASERATDVRDAGSGLSGTRQTTPRVA
jgi:transcriptional regulator HilA, main transcriptional regulator of SPI1